jgi:membrane complex biogenesis BtpA family protein
LDARHIGVLADVDVKHSMPLGERRAIEDEVDDTIHRGLADGLIVSGAGTGKATDLEQVRRVKAAAGATPVFVGSGITAAIIGETLRVADGAIVGSSIKKDGVAVNPVDPQRVRALLEAVQRGSR